MNTPLPEPAYPADVREKDGEDAYTADQLRAAMVAAWNECADEAEKVATKWLKSTDEYSLVDSLTALKETP